MTWKTRRLRKHAAPAGSGLSWSQAEDATLLWHAGLPLVNLVTKVPATVDGTWAQSMGPAGLGCRGGSGGTPHIEFAAPANATSTDYTVFAYVNDDTGAGATRNPIDGDDSSSNRVFQLRFKSDDGVEFITFDTSGNPYFATGAAISFAPRVGLLVGRIVANTLTVWWQGKLQATGTASGTPRAVSAAALVNIAVNKTSSLTLTNAFQGQVLFAGHINRGWSDNEIISKSANPLEIFAPISRMWPTTPPSGGGGGGGGLISAISHYYSMMGAS